MSCMLSQSICCMMLCVIFFTIIGIVHWLIRIFRINKTAGELRLQQFCCQYKHSTKNQYLRFVPVRYDKAACLHKPNDQASICESVCVPTWLTEYIRKSARKTGFKTGALY